MSALRIFVVITLALCLGSCASPYRDGLALIESGNVEVGLVKLEEAAKAEPGSRLFRTAYFRQREIAVQRLFAAAQTAWSQGQPEVAETAYRRILAIDPENSRAKAGLEALTVERRELAVYEEVAQWS